MSDEYDYAQEDKAALIEAEAEIADAVSTNEVKQLVALREVRDRDKSAAEVSEREYRAYEDFIWNKLDEHDDNGTDKTIPNVGRVKVGKRSTIYARVIDLDQLLDALEQTGRLDELTKPGIEKRRLNELVRECIENGNPLPDGADFYEKRYLQIRVENKENG